MNRTKQLNTLSFNIFMKNEYLKQKNEEENIF